MAGERESFYTSRPGTDQGRVAASGITVPEGSQLLALGSDTAGRVAWLKKGDQFDIFQSDTPAAAAKILRFQGGWRGPVACMPAVSAEVGPPNFYVLANGQTLILAIDEGVNQTVTFATAQFADITKARPLEVVTVLNASLTGATASLTGRGAFKVVSDTSGKRSRVRVVGGTAAALVMEELAWKAALLVGGNEVASRILRSGESQTLTDMAANLIGYIAAAPFEVKFRLEVVAV
jgi:hypothetical protein